MKISNETKVGILATFAIVIVILGVNFLRGKNVLTHSTVYYAKFKDVGGLGASNAVMLYGVKIGQVDELTFLQLVPVDPKVRRNLDSMVNDINKKLSMGFPKDKAGIFVKDSLTLALEGFKTRITHLEQRVEVRFHVTSGMEFPANSVAKIKSDLLGAKTLEIVPGDAKIMLPKGDTMAGAVELTLPEELSNTVSPIKDKVNALVGSIDTVVTSLNEIFNDKTKRDLRNAFASIGPTIRNIEETTEGMSTFLKSETGRFHDILFNIDKISQNISSYNASITKVIDNIASMTDTVRALNFRKTITEATQAIRSVNDMLTSIKNGQGTLGKLMTDDKLYQELRSATRNIDKLVFDLKNNPNKYLAPLGKKNPKPDTYKPDTAK